MAATSFMRTWQDFDLIQLVILPLFLFSATFFPIETYPPALQVIVQLTPLYQGVDLHPVADGRGDQRRSLLFHVAYLASWASPACSSCRAGSTSCCSSSGRRRPDRGAPAALAALTAEIVACRRCPRLVAWRERVAREKVARLPRRDRTGAGRCPGFGDPDARILRPRARAGGARRQPDRAASSPATRRATSCGRRCIAPAWPISRRRAAPTTGCALIDAYIAAAVRCAPPANKPTSDGARHAARRSSCGSWRARPRCGWSLALGAFGWDAGAADVRGARARGAAAEAAVRPRRGGAHRAVHAARLATTRASRTPSPAG